MYIAVPVTACGSKQEQDSSPKSWAIAYSGAIWKMAPKLVVTSSASQDPPKCSNHRTLASNNAEMSASIKSRDMDLCSQTAEIAKDNSAQPSAAESSQEDSVSTADLSPLTDTFPLRKKFEEYDQETGYDRYRGFRIADPHRAFKTPTRKRVYAEEELTPQFGQEAKPHFTEVPETFPPESYLTPEQTTRSKKRFKAIVSPPANGAVDSSQKPHGV